MSELIRCQIRINKIFYPKNPQTLQPGDWASFSAKVTDLVMGDIRYRRSGDLRVKGPVPSLHTGKLYSLTAQFSNHEKYGPQYAVLCMNEVVNFHNPIEQRQFLERILTDTQVNRLYEQLENPFKAIQAGDAQALCAVKGIGEATAQKLIKLYHANIDNGNAYVELDGYGLTKHMIDKLIQHYKSADTLIDRIHKNPYLLVDEVDGIGWKKADEMALASGLSPQSVERVSAFIKYYLQREALQGSTWVPASSLINACAAELALQNADTLRQALYTLYGAKELWWDEQKTMFALPRLKTLEQSIALELARLAFAPVQLPTVDFKDTLVQLQKEQGLEYTKEQVNAIRLVLQSNVSIITGYGGTGKSTVVAAVLKLLGAKEFAQTALSGRAASRLSEITSEEGYTIHRLLRFSPITKSFEINKDNPLREEVIILDEVSMVGAELFLSLVSAIRSGSRLIMIGDDGQLESIGLCNIFRDMLDSGVIPVARLTQIHRQAAKSAIITQSIRVRTANQLVPAGWTGSEVRGELQDLELDIYGDAILSQPHILAQYQKLCQQGQSADSVQVVLPQKYRGEICTAKLNTLLQRYANPNGANEITISAKAKDTSCQYTLRENDKVIISCNHYDTRTEGGKICPVFNGNRGTVCSISSKRIIIDFDQWGKVVIPPAYWKDIELAYALTCHKLQGSEADYVIVGLDFSARSMLTREWLYTAITRAKKRCILCAETKALAYTICNSNLPYKRTFLVNYLQTAFSSKSTQKEQQGE